MNCTIADHLDHEYDDGYDGHRDHDEGNHDKNDDL